MNKEETKYYFISDLHIGGDAALDICDFEEELIDFLRMLEKEEEKGELIIVGDLFGFWEMSGPEGAEKLDKIITTHSDLFEQFKQTGEKIAVTVIPGNHDYHLACDGGLAELLERYNIALEPKEHIIRYLGERKIWIEHGSQRDPMNRARKFGDPYVTPFGYYITSHITATAGRYSDYGRGDWLKEVESIQPYENYPDWILSNYFYREMSPFLRWVMVPFLALFTAGILAFVGMFLEQAGILGTDIFNLMFLKPLGIFGKLFGIILLVDAVLVAFFLILAIPFFFILRDLRGTLRRYGLKRGEEVTIQKSDVYLKAAQKIFERDPEVLIYVFGHTHTPFLKRMGERAVINTGTWLKRLVRVRSRFRFLPDVYLPTFRLNYFTIYREGETTVIDYKIIPRPTPSGLTFLQKLVTLGRKRKDPVDIPERTVLTAD